MRENDFTTLLASKIKGTVQEECELHGSIANTQISMEKKHEKECCKCMCMHSYIHTNTTMHIQMHIDTCTHTNMVKNSHTNMLKKLIEY